MIGAARSAACSTEDSDGPSYRSDGLCWEEDLAVAVEEPQLCVGEPSSVGIRARDRAHVGVCVHDEVHLGAV